MVALSCVVGLSFMQPAKAAIARIPIAVIKVFFINTLAQMNNNVSLYNFGRIFSQWFFSRALHYVAFGIESASMQAAFKAVTGRRQLVVGMGAAQQKRGVGIIGLFAQTYVIV